MKKKLKLIAVIGSFIVLVAIYSFTIMREGKANFLMTANLEALAQGEGGSSNSWPCYSMETHGLGYWKCGNPCQWIDGAGGKGDTSKCYKNN